MSVPEATDSVTARMAQVCGHPPRLAPLEDEALGERALAIVERMRELTAYPPEEPIHPFFSTLAHQPEFFESYMQLGIAAMASATLPRRTRELVILRTGWLCGAPYQFGEHVKTGRQAGLTEADVARIKLGSQAAGWDAADRAVLSAAEELHAEAMICDATWAALAERLSPPELIELLMIAGHYHTTAFLQNTLRFRLNDYNRGLEAG